MKKKKKKYIASDPKLNTFCHYIKVFSLCFVQLDPDNPFYLPQHLRDNPEQLENVLQDKLTTSSPPGLEQETISTLLE